MVKISAPIDGASTITQSKNTQNIQLIVSEVHDSTTHEYSGKLKKIKNC
jgi:hypothetical protein